MLTIEGWKEACGGNYREQKEWLRVKRRLEEFNCGSQGGNF